MNKSLTNFDQYKILTFDCYGTLIDWENGILNTLKPFFRKYNINLTDNKILELYAKLESEIEKGEYIKYKEVLRKIMQKIGNQFNITISSQEKNILVDSLKNWEPFPDTIEALRTLKRRYKLAIISNIDDNLFAYSANYLKIEFDYIITAEQVKDYKPSLDNFKFAINKMSITPEKILHVAQSLYHDIIPAKKLELSTVWINRRKDKEGSGATPPANGHPDYEAPDLKTLIHIMGLK